MNICLFESHEIGQPLPLRDERAQHIIKILHKKTGDSFYAGIIDGPDGQATITAINSAPQKSADGKKEFASGSLEFIFTPNTNPVPLYPLTMVIGFPRPIQLKRLLRDIAGLGVQNIHLTATELGEKSYLNSELAKPSECRKMLLEGVEQAGGTCIPKVFFHHSLKECLDVVKAEYQDAGCANCLCLDNINPSMSLGAYLEKSLLAPGSAKNLVPVVAAIGAERGWTDKERAMFRERGFSLISMGSRILRTETACTVAASLILSRMGVLD